MSMVRRLTLCVMLAFLSLPAAAETEDLRAEFDAVIQGLNRNSFEKFLRAIDRSDMTDRIYARRMVDPAVKSAFAQEFSTSIQQMFTSSFPPSKRDILGTVVDFRFTGDEGRAVVRYGASGYRFIYHVYELRADPNGRLYIADWLDYFQGSRFSEEAGTALVMALPSKEATRYMMADKTLDDGQIFQASELFKAARDKKPERFFQIHDDLGEQLLAEKAVVRLNWQMALSVEDAPRIEAAAERVVRAFSGEALQSTRLVEYYIQSGQFENVISELDILQRDLGVTDGAIGSLKTSAAIALGNLEEAEQYALEATRSEPTLELSWWSLLRARSAAGNYGGATEAMARLEDDFGESLDPRRLEKDPYLRVLADKQEYLDWRASRD